MSTPTPTFTESVDAPFYVLGYPGPAELDALLIGPRKASIDSFADHAALKLITRQIWRSAHEGRRVRSAFYVAIAILRE